LVNPRINATQIYLTYFSPPYLPCSTFFFIVSNLSFRLFFFLSTILSYFVGFLFKPQKNNTNNKKMQEILPNNATTFSFVYAVKLFFFFADLFLHLFEINKTKRGCACLRVWEVDTRTIYVSFSLICIQLFFKTFFAFF